MCCRWDIYGWCRWWHFSQWCAEHWTKCEHCFFHWFIIHANLMSFHANTIYIQKWLRWSFWCHRRSWASTNTSQVTPCLYHVVHGLLQHRACRITSLHNWHASTCAEFTQFIWWEENEHWVVADLWTAWATSTGSWSTTFTIAIYYLLVQKLILMEDRRLSQARWLVTIDMVYMHTDSHHQVLNGPGIE